MKKIYILLPFLVFGFSMFAQEAKKKDYTDALKFVEVWLDAQKDFDNLPGISAVVVDDQEIIWKGGFGESNMAEGIGTDPATICSICSISKLFTSIAVMKLYEEGKLSLDDEIQDILPWFSLKQRYEGSGPITIRAILTHSAGLPREANASYWSAPDFEFPEDKDFEEGLAELETLYPSSTYFQYSNLGLALLGKVVEEVSGKDYDTYIEENILEPLGLKDTRSFLPKELYGKEMAIGYSAKKRDGDREVINFFEANAITPAAGFSSNVLDLAKFASWQFRLLNEDAGYEVLKSSTLKYMQNVQWVDPDFDTMWGLGFSVYKGPDGSKWVGHGGSCPGYRTVVSLNTKTKMAFSVMINAGGESPEKYVRGMHSILSKGQLSSDNDSKVKLDDYVGHFNPQPWASEMYIGKWGDKLALIYLPSSSPGSDLTFFKHVKGDEFRRVRENGELGESISFIRDEDGNITKMKRYNNFYTKINK